MERRISTDDHLCGFSLQMEQLVLAVVVGALAPGQVAAVDTSPAVIQLVSKHLVKYKQAN